MIPLESTSLPPLPSDCRRWPPSTGILLKGERVWNLEKRFNIAAGVEKDTLPPRLLREQLPEGPAKGKVSELHTMLEEYYQLRGWDSEGIPTEDKVKELGL